MYRYFLKRLDVSQGLREIREKHAPTVLVQLHRGVTYVIMLETIWIC